LVVPSRRGVVGHLSAEDRDFNVRPCVAAELQTAQPSVGSVEIMDEKFALRI
jgi:hypothetical protein